MHWFFLEGYSVCCSVKEMRGKRTDQGLCRAFCSWLIRLGDKVLWIRILKISKLLFWSRVDLLRVGFLKIFQFLGTRVDLVKVNLLADSVEIYEKTSLSIEP